jgi:Ser/Thr protein kinase RdoA (MazF antagonist)
MGTGLEAPSWPVITAPEAQAVLARLPSAGRFQALEWHSPRPFAAAALVRTDRGTLFVKRHHRRVRSPAGLRAEHAFIAHLGARGLPVATILHDARGATALAQGEWVWEVHSQAPGRDLYRDRPSWTPFLNGAQAHAAGAALARLHHAAEGFAAPARPAEPLVTGMTVLSSVDPLAGAAAYIAARPALGDYLADKPWRRDLARLFAQWDAPGLRAEPALWTHNDWHPSNLLWNADDSVASVLDFGLADRTCALYDLAIALERSAVRWLELDGSDRPIAEIDDARALIAGYAEVRPLDRDRLARLLPLVHVEFALSEADYFHGVLGRRDDADLAWHGYLLGHGHWFGSAEGQALLAAIREG